MKKQVAILGAVLLLAALSGCIQPIPDPGIRLISAEGVLYPPLCNGIPLHYDANVQPGDKLVLDWGTGKDQYGNHVGLSDDQRWTIREVRFQCDVKPEEDTVFWPANLGENQCVWFPGWTAPIEMISGLPLPMYPLEGYPWDSCGSHVLPDMPSQGATIAVSAEASWIEVEVVFVEAGDYQVQWPGEMLAVQASGESASRRLSESGDVVVTQGAQTWTFIVPAAWFWMDAEVRVRVGPTGTC